MSASVLVAYATRSGSTREVAEAVGQTLCSHGVDVDLRHAREVRDLDDYQAVVLGAPLYMFCWHKDARRFLARHRQALVELPVAVFALGPFHDEEKGWKDVRAQLDKQLGQFPWFTPVAIEVVGGVFNPAKLGFPFSRP